MGGQVFLRQWFWMENYIDWTLKKKVGFLEIESVYICKLSPEAMYFLLPFLVFLHVYNNVHTLITPKRPHKRRPNQHWFCCINIPPKVSLPPPLEEGKWTKSKTCCFHFSEWINYGYVCKFFNMILWFCKNWLQALFKYWQRLVHSYKAVQNPGFQFAITLDDGKIQPNSFKKAAWKCLVIAFSLY